MITTKGISKKGVLAHKFNGTVSSFVEGQKTGDNPITLCIIGSEVDVDSDWFTKEVWIRLSANAEVYRCIGGELDRVEVAE